MSDKEKDSDSGGESEEEEPTPAQDLVVTKYKMAADIANAVLKELVGRCTDGQSVAQLCDEGDRLLAEKTSKVFKKEKDVKKGPAFPTCISVNNCICHFSPLKSEAETFLKDGDMVKLDLGAHIDGFIAAVAHTVVVGEDQTTGRKADVILAAAQAVEAAIRSLRPDANNKNFDVTDIITKIADAYNCKPVENMISHQLTRNKIDGQKQIIQNPGEKQRQELEKCSFDNYDVFAIDVLMSTGEGKARESDARTTVYKKADDLVYQLKMKASRTFLSEADKRFGMMPFSLRAFEDETRAKMGVKECVEHGLMKPYQVLYERDGEWVAQFKTTVLLMPTGLLKITGLPLDTGRFQSEHKIQDPKLVQLLQSSLKPHKKKAKKKAAAAANQNGAE